MNSDPYTHAMRLCDDTGLVSDQPIHDPAVPSTDRTYLERLNRLRNHTLVARGDKPETLTESFHCTGNAHLMGEHIRCTSVAHHQYEPSFVTERATLLRHGITVDPYDTARVDVPPEAAQRLLDRRPGTSR